MFPARAALAAAMTVSQAEALPPVSLDDLRLLPAADFIDRQLQSADAHHAWLLDRAATHGWGWGLREWADEARELRHTWELLRLARGEPGEWGDPAPLAALRDLRERIGARAYYQGYLPPAVPAWRFSRAD